MNTTSTTWKTVKNIEVVYYVMADHPIMNRPDKLFQGADAMFESNRYALTLLDAGFDNVRITVQDKSQTMHI